MDLSYCDVESITFIMMSRPASQKNIHRIWSERSRVLAKMLLLTFFEGRQIWIVPSSYITRNSSGDEIANVNFLYDYTVHAQKIDSCINCATDRFLQPTFTKIQWNNAM